MKKYMITTKQQMVVLLHSVFILGGVTAIVFYFSLPIAFYVNLSVIGFIFIFDTLPTIILHVQYYLVNRRAMLSLDKTNRMGYYQKGKNRFDFYFDDIVNLNYFVSYGRKTGVYSFALYRYYEITFKDDKKLIITCLMVNDIENTLENIFRVATNKRLRFICFLKSKDNHII